MQVINFILLTTKKKKEIEDGKMEKHLLIIAYFPQFPHKIRKIAIPYLTSTVFAASVPSATPVNSAMCDFFLLNLILEKDVDGYY